MPKSRNIHRSALWIKREAGRKPHRVMEGREEKHCISCNSWKALTEFSVRKDAWDNLYAYCKPCRCILDRGSRQKLRDRLKAQGKTAYQGSWQQRNPEARSDYARRVYRTLRTEVIEAYGGCCCQCGFTDRRALHIDHVNGDGSQDRKKHRTALQMVRWIIRNHFPSGYQILCANCNCIKMFENKEFPGWKSFMTQG